MPLLLSVPVELPSEQARERKEAQRNLLPLLQAESDRQYIRERKVKIMIEKEVMKEFPDWQPGENVYRTVDWMPPMPAPEDLFFRGPSCLSFANSILSLTR